MNRKKERLIKYLFTTLAFASLAFLIGIVLVLFKEALPIFAKVGPKAFLLGESWYPTAEPPEFGILPLILASLWVTAGALVICVPLGVGSALYLHELAGPRQRAVLKPVIEILASVPSIVYGFFGMVILAPWLQDTFELPIGLCVLTTSIILGVMATPTVASIAEDALSYVPRSFREASFAVGADRWQTLTKVIIPAAGSGIHRHNPGHEPGHRRDHDRADGGRRVRRNTFFYLRSGAAHDGGHSGRDGRGAGGQRTL